MKTVGEFKKAGLEFVDGDERSSIHKGHGNVQMTKEMAFGTNKDDKTDRETVISFAWRESTGVKPEFSGLIDAVTAYKCEYERISPDSAALEFEDDRFDCYVIKWRPSLNQQSIAEPSTKESAIHKAWVELKGDLSSVISIADDEDDKLIISVTCGHYSFGSITKSNDRWEIVCTIQEFTDYCKKMAAEEKRMKVLVDVPKLNPTFVKDVNGQMHRDETGHYGKTAQHVEASTGYGFISSCLVFTQGSKPIFTQAMADALILPPVGSEFLPIENEKDAQTCLGYTSRGKVVGEGVGGGVVSLFFIDKIKPLDTRTDREKAVDAALHEWPVADKATLEMAYDFWRVGDI